MFRAFAITSNRLTHILVWLVLWGSVSVPVRAVETRRASVGPGFSWPASAGDIPTANKVSRSAVEAFVSAAEGWGAGERPDFGDFQFVQLEAGMPCLVAGWGGRNTSFNEVICPIQVGGFRISTLPAYAPWPLAWYAVDLNGDGQHEFISAETLNGYIVPGAPPVFWYEVYEFRDGAPHDVSARFRDFFRVALLGPLAELERFVTPPLGCDSKQSAEVRADIEFIQLKYHRRILGEKKAGLEQALLWARSPESDAQMLAVGTLREIDDPGSIQGLKQLTSSRYQGVCRSAVDALAELQHQDITGDQKYSKCKGPAY
jgi:hypothetical protein